MTEILDPRREQMIAEYADDLVSGKVFAKHANSHRGRFSYMPPIDRRAYSQIVRTLGDMAAESDSLAQIASAIVGRVNLYGTRAQVCASIYDAAAGAVAKPYRDVIGQASPEPNRESDARRKFTTGEVALVAMYLAAATKGLTDSTHGIGWVLARIVEDCGLTHRKDALGV